MMAWLLPGLVAALLIARVLLAATLAPGRDELAYWYWAWHGLDAGYSLVTVGFVRLSTAMLGDSPFAMRLPTLAAGIASISLVVAAAGRLGASRDAAWAGGLALAASPWHVYVSAVVHPDAWFSLFVLAFAVTLRRGRGGPFGIAVTASLATLSKLPGTWLVLVAAWTLLRRRSERTALAAAALLLVPAFLLLRDADPRVLAGIHEFGRFSGDVGPWERLAWTITEVAAGSGPALLLAAGAGAVALRERSLRNAWPGWSVAALLLLFFLAFFGVGQAKGNWFLPSLVILVPLGAAALDAAGQGGALRRAAFAGAAMSIALTAFALLPEVARERLRAVAGIDATYARRMGDRESAVSTTRTWSARVAEYQRHPTADPRVAEALASGAVAIASDDYGVAFAQARALGREVRVLLPWDPVFARTCGDSPGRGEDVVFVSAGRSEPAVGWRASFEECRPLAADDPKGETPASGPPLHVVLCTCWTGLAMSASPLVIPHQGELR